VRNFGTPQYQSWVEHAWDLCKKKNSAVTFVSVWNNAGYRCYSGNKCGLRRLTTKSRSGGLNTKSWQKLASTGVGTWSDLGAGCCRQSAAVSARRYLFNGRLVGQAGLAACKAKCVSFGEECGFVNYGWAGSRWCSVIKASASCSSETLDSSANGCGSSGSDGVRSYIYTAGAKQKKSRTKKGANKCFYLTTRKQNLGCYFPCSAGEYQISSGGKSYYRVDTNKGTVTSVGGATHAFWGCSKCRKGRLGCSGLRPNRIPASHFSVKKVRGSAKAKELTVAVALPSLTMGARDESSAMGLDTLPMDASDESPSQTGPRQERLLSALHMQEEALKEKEALLKEDYKEATIGEEAAQESAAPPTITALQGEQFTRKSEYPAGANANTILHNSYPFGRTVDIQVSLPDYPTEDSIVPEGSL